jgi:uncharacterized membrane protein YoaK (UPF0700 family)
MIRYLHFLTGRERTREANRHLGMTLAFVAGATNAGGYLAVSQYTSHMTGVLSSIADNLALSRFHLVAGGIATFCSFLAGAAVSAILINWARRKKLQSEYALALLLEAALMASFGPLGHNLRSLDHAFVPATVCMLAFMMGLQNAIITKISGAEIRTTHMTGNATDLGIELGKLLYWNRDETSADRVLANREKLKIHAGLIALFTGGGCLGALGFKRLGFGVTVPLALLLLAIAVVPVWEDLAPHSPGPAETGL